MPGCQKCGRSFPAIMRSNGQRLDLTGRKHCLECKPHRALRGPRKSVGRLARQRRCERCGQPFTAKPLFDGKVRSSYRRRFCFTCSPFGAHNTSKIPPGPIPVDAIAEHRRRRRNAKTYRHQKKARRESKAELIAARGGRCQDCGYDGAAAVLEFHHRDAASKEFEIGSGSVSHDRLWSEAAKCDLLCANCHRSRHLTSPSDREHTIVALRRERKRRAVTVLGGCCRGCGSSVPAPLFEFHHLDATTKEFAISSDGALRSWDRIEAELAKCVLLCVNCHREVHAGIRSIQEAQIPLG